MANTFSLNDVENMCITITHIIFTVRLILYVSDMWKDFWNTVYTHIVCIPVDEQKWTLYTHINNDSSCIILYYDKADDYNAIRDHFFSSIFNCFVHITLWSKKKAKIKEGRTWIVDIMEKRAREYLNNGYKKNKKENFLRCQFFYFLYRKFYISDIS